MKHRIYPAKDAQYNSDHTTTILGSNYDPSTIPKLGLAAGNNEYTQLAVT